MPLRRREDISRSGTNALDGGDGIEVPESYRVRAVTSDEDVAPGGENEGVDTPVSPVRGPPISCARLGLATSQSRIE